MDIRQYSKQDLEDILELGPTYDVSTLTHKCDQLIQNIRNDRSLTPQTKTSMPKFIEEAKQLLLNLIHTQQNMYNLDKSPQPIPTFTTNTHVLQRKAVTPYGQSSPSEFYEGTINPLNKRILRQNLNIDTRFRDNYYQSSASNFHVNLPIKLSNVVSLQLSALEMPNTFFVVSNTFGNNFFALQVEGYDVCVVTVPNGNYDYLSLQDYLNQFMTTETAAPYNEIRFLADANTPNGSGPSGGSGRMVVGSVSGTLVFTLNFNTDAYGNDDPLTPLPLKFGWLMGFRMGTYENNVSYVSEGVVNLTGPKYIYLVVDDFNNSVLDGFYAAFTSSILNKNILARISLQANSFHVFSKDNLNLLSTPRQYFGPVDIQHLHIQLLDEYGRVFNLNNMDYSLCLTFQTVYDL